jgi:RNA methyltransferase, TrmH family
MIQSTANEKIKEARRVRDGREPGFFFIEGLRLAEEAVKSGLKIRLALADPSWQSEARAMALLSQLPVQWASAQVLESLSGTVQSQGIQLIAHRPVPAAHLPTDGRLWLALEQVQDPGNVGTLLRTAEAAGVAAILATPGCADPYAPKVLRSAMGSAFRLPLWRDVSEEKLRAECREAGFQLVCATAEAELEYTDYDWRQKTCLLLGNEAKGVSAEMRDCADVCLRIPMAASVESLNVASAGAVLLFEAARQHRLG